MKGLVFTEFMGMVEQNFSYELLDTIIEKAQLPNHGAYTAVGTYDYHELVMLVQQLSAETDAPIPDLLKAFGRYLFGRFLQLYLALFDGTSDCFQFLANLDGYIHSEVRKLYPNAELPSFTYEMLDDRQMLLIYRSKRPFSDLAEGLITGCIENFNEEISLRRDDFSTLDHAHVNFYLQKQT